MPSNTEACWLRLPNLPTSTISLPLPTERTAATTMKAKPRQQGLGEQRLIASRSLTSLAVASVDPATGRVLERKGARTGPFRHATNWDGSCPRLLAPVAKDGRSPLRPLYFGAPFLLGNATPILLEGVPPAANPERFLPAEGRRLLSFTDSRQGTARFAANIETNAERGFIPQLSIPSRSEGTAAPRRRGHQGRRPPFSDRGAAASGRQR